MNQRVVEIDSGWNERAAGRFVLCAGMAMVFLFGASGWTDGSFADANKRWEVILAVAIGFMLSLMGAAAVLSRRRLRIDPGRG